MFGHLDDMQKLAAKNVDSSVKRLCALAGDTQAVTREVTNYTMDSFQRGAKTYAALLDTRSYDAALEVQNEYVQACFDNYIAQIARLGELRDRFAGEVSAGSEPTASAQPRPERQGPAPETARPPEVERTQSRAENEPGSMDKAAGPNAAMPAGRAKSRPEGAELRAS